MGKDNILFSMAGVKMWIDDDIPCLINEWDGFITSDNFKKAIRKLVSLLGEYSGEYGKLNMLADTRNLAVISTKDLDWVNTEINSQYVKNGASYEAFVIPEDAFGKNSVKKYVEMSTSEGVFTAKYFASIEEAKSWLQEVHNDK